MLVVVAVMGVIGAIKDAQNELAEKEKITLIETCHDGVVYLIYSKGKRISATPKINEDHYPYTCNLNQGVKNE